jgi:hypothetical protein
MSALPGWGKRWVVGFGKAVLAIAIVMGSLGGYAAYAEKKAYRQASTFCSTVHAGSAVEGLLERAIAAGASEQQSRWMEWQGSDTLLATYTGVPPFSRHICSVTAQGGRVVEAKLAYID